MTAALSTVNIAAIVESEQRVKMREAVRLIGKEPRVVQQMAEAGEIDGALKQRGQWTFHLGRLLKQLEEQEKKQCASRQINVAAKPRRIASGVATPSTGASRSMASSSAGRYEQAMQTLLDHASKKTSRG